MISRKVGPPTLNHPASQQGGGEEEKIPGRRSLGGKEECRVRKILFKQGYLYLVPCELWAGQQKLMYQLSAEE